jgi:RsiW-degrading membrane proteinase PrsW (M82 family)
MGSSHPVPVTGEREADAAADGRFLRREATTMALYVSIVLLATLAALPGGHDGEEEALHGPVGIELIAVLWGTTIGLAVAHSFAFVVATQGLGGGRLRGHDLEEVMAELAGAASVAAVASLPVLLLSEETEQQVVPFVLAVVIGVVGYFVERLNGRTRLASVVFGVITLVVGLLAAGVKNHLSGH